MSKPPDFKLDTRIRDRLLRSRALDAAELKSHLDALPDLEDEIEVLREVPQPAVTPPRTEPVEEPIIFDGIRRLQALASVGADAPSPPPPPEPAPASDRFESGYVAGANASAGVPPATDGTPGEFPALHSALSGSMESEISGVGAGAVSAALGAMAAEAAGVSGFGSPPAEPPPPPPEAAPPPPAAEPVAEPFARAPAEVPEPAPAEPAWPQALAAAASAVEASGGGAPEPPPPTPVTLRSETQDRPSGIFDTPAEAPPVAEPESTEPGSPEAEPREDLGDPPPRDPA